MSRIQEIDARLAAINDELDGAAGEPLTALETEVNSLTQERSALVGEIEQRKALRDRIANDPALGTKANTTGRNDVQERAEQFARTNSMTLDAEQTRAQLISSGTIAAPTTVSGIHEKEGAKYSSLLDLIRVENWKGAAAHEVAYEASDAAAADALTEGQAATSKEPTYAYLTITPTEDAVISQISEKVRKLSPLNYEAKVREQAFVSLRKAVLAKVVAKMKASTLVQTVNAPLTSANKGKIDEKTLRSIVMQYGGDESIVGEAVLMLNKTDLLEFGDVRGTNEKKAVYEITPDTANQNMGTIKDGGLTVRYCLVSGLTACAGTAQTAAAIPTMFYGNPMNIELDLFSDYEIETSRDHEFAKFMLTIRGSEMTGAEVVVKNGLVAWTIPAAANS